MIYILTFLAGATVGYIAEYVFDILSDEYDNDSQH